MSLSFVYILFLFNGYIKLSRYITEDISFLELLFLYTYFKIYKYKKFINYNTTTKIV